MTGLGAAWVRVKGSLYIVYTKALSKYFWFAIHQWHVYFNHLWRKNISCQNFANGASKVNCCNLRPLLLKVVTSGSNSQKLKAKFVSSKEVTPSSWSWVWATSSSTLLCTSLLLLQICNSHSSSFFSLNCSVFLSTFLNSFFKLCHLCLWQEENFERTLMSLSLSTNSWRGREIQLSAEDRVDIQKFTLSIMTRKKTKVRKCSSYSSVVVHAVIFVVLDTCDQNQYYKVGVTRNFFKKI